ncbi:MAG: hypothetical protein V2B19_19380 [Pseudomonadota bacterium]
MIQSLENSVPHFDHWSKGDQSYAMTESTQARLTQSQSTDVVLYTQDGDKVTLSSSTQFQAKYASYESLAGAGSAMAWKKGESFEMSTGAQFSLTVEGNLNAREKADIQKALKTIDKIMTDLISGKSDQTIQRAENLGRLDTLQSLSAELHIQKEVYYEHRETTMIATDASASESDPPVNQVIPEALETTEAAAVNSITEAIQASGTVKEKLISSLNQYFSDLGKKMADGRPDGSGKAAMIDRVKSGVLEHIEEMRQSD